MTKKEFLAFSLPYGLKCTANGLEKGHRLKGIFEDKYTLSNNSYGGYFSHMIENIKPILHPLSDLTKEIEHKGECFVPIDFFDVGEEDNFEYTDSKVYRLIESISNRCCSHDVFWLPFAVILKLIEWRFDLFGGIDSGDAIDVNSLHENPYK